MGELNEWRCGVELRTPNDFLKKTRMTMNDHKYVINKFVDNSWIFVLREKKE